MRRKRRPDRRGRLDSKVGRADCHNLRASRGIQVSLIKLRRRHFSREFRRAPCVQMNNPCLLNKVPNGARRRLPTAEQPSRPF